MALKKQQKEQIILAKAHHDYRKDMHSYTFFKTHDQAKSEDLVQDTFLKTWQYLVRKGRIDLMKPFLYHVLNRLIIDEYRKKNRKYKVSSLDTLLENGFDTGLNHSERMIDACDGKTALLLIQYLPAKYERVIYMRYVQELSIKEISRITGQSRNVVAVQTHRGLAKLRELYNHS